MSLSSLEKNSYKTPQSRGVKRKNPDDDYPQSSSNSPLASDDSLPGTIAKIVLKNFMCHDHLEVELNKNINFIIGKNGSGKSAILTGLVVGLGGNASVTNRGTSIKEFVKKGRLNGSIEVTLNNCGTTAYKPDIYGKKIIILRTLSSSTGQGSYKIKSASGEVKSTKREELDSIVAALNIQIDNPISVLNQDVARTFLHSTDPKTKYKFFKKATQLDDVYFLHDLTLEFYEKGDKMVAQKKKMESSLAHEIKTLEKKLKKAQSIDTIKQQIKLLENELLWARVKGQENRLALVTELYEKEKEQQTSETQCLENCKSQIEHILQKKRNITDKQQKLHSKQTETNEQLRAAKEELKKVKQTHFLKQQEYNIKKTQLEHCETDINTLCQEIDQINKMSGFAFAEKKQKLLADIVAKEEKEKTIVALLKTKDNDYHQLKESVSRFIKDEESVVNEKKIISYKIGQMQKRIKGIKSEDSLSIYGEWVPNVLKIADAAHRKGKLRQPVIGPIGSYIKLRDSSWAPAIEDWFTFAFLRGFCVDNPHDAEVLREICNSLKVDRMPSIYITKFFNQVHNVEANLVVAEGYNSLLKSLIISHPVIENFLIDTRNIESVLLIPSFVEATEMMSNRYKVPRNCKRAVTKSGDTYFPDPNYKSYAGRGSKSSKLLQAAMEDIIRDLQSEIFDCTKKVQNADKQLFTIKENIAKSKDELTKINFERSSLAKERHNVSKEVIDLKNSVEPEPASLTSLTAELNDIKERNEELKKEEINLQGECRELERKAAEVKTGITELEQENEKLIFEMKPSHEEASTYELKEKRMKLKLNELEQILGNQNEKIKHIEMDLQTRKAKLNESIVKALSLCSRIETERDPNFLSNELSNLNNYLKKATEQQATYAELCSQLAEKKAFIGSVQHDLETFLRAKEIFPKVLTRRNHLYEQMLKVMCCWVQVKYQSVINLRKYTGSITFDLEKGAMNVTATPQGQNVENTDLKALSGGERSFSTVAFIVALWDVVNTPFFFMDEYDVFLDKMNQRLIMDLILIFAKSKSSQFVFLTPQDTPPRDLSSKITIHRLSDPARNTITAGSSQH